MYCNEAVSCPLAYDYRTTTTGAPVKERAGGYMTPSVSTSPSSVISQSVAAIGLFFLLGIHSICGVNILNVNSTTPNQVANVTAYKVNSSSSDESKNKHIQKSDLLRSAFGFKKIAPWARVLQVERKTIYDWMKRPGTVIHPRIIARIDALNELYRVMEPSHRKYVYTMAFGKWSDEDFTSLLLKSELDDKELVNSYDRLFMKFVGLEKREILSRA